MLELEAEPDFVDVSLERLDLLEYFHCRQTVCSGPQLVELQGDTFACCGDLGGPTHRAVDKKLE